LRGNLLISAIVLITGALVSAFIFLADYWETFQGNLQDPIFYFSFVMPGLLFSLFIAFLFAENESGKKKIMLVSLITLSWTILYLLCLKLFVEGVIDSSNLAGIELTVGTIGAVTIAGILKFFKKVQLKNILIAGVIGLVSTGMGKFLISPFIERSFLVLFNDLQSAGILIMLWQLCLGIYFLYLQKSESWVLSNSH
jgi:hypothetical protein